MDRTVSTGTGFVEQYSKDVQEIYETASNTPDNLLLFFHHVPYRYKLHSGRSVIQTIYDLHYEGAVRAADFVRIWRSIHGYVDDERYSEVLAQLTYQANHAIVWRDAINNWFYRLSGTPDEKGRVGQHPERVEAEAMTLTGYTLIDVVPWETASAGKAVVCPQARRFCAAETKFEGAAGWYEVDSEYFDQNNGVSQFRLFLNDQLVDEWPAALGLPTAEPNGDSATRHLTKGLALRPGDTIRIEGIPDRGERAPLDYIEIHPSQE
jgi:alpha-glucuronidase